MKAFLLLSFLVYINCINFSNVVDVAICLFQKPQFKEEALNIYEAVKSKDFLKILSTATSAFFNLKEVALNECMKDDDVNLQLKICKHLAKYLICVKDCGLPDDSPRYCNCMHDCKATHCTESE